MQHKAGLEKLLYHLYKKRYKEINSQINKTQKHGTIRILAPLLHHSTKQKMFVSKTSKGKKIKTKQNKTKYIKLKTT